VARRVFVPFPGAPALARVPLLSLAWPGAAVAEPVDPVVREGMFLASRQADMIAGAPGRPQDSSGAATVRSYTIRARARPTPQGVFAGVAAALGEERGGRHGLSMGGGHRARSVPDSRWLAEVSALALDDPDVLPLLTLSANNLAVQRGERLEHERPAEPGTAGVRRVTVRATGAVTLVVKLCARGARWGEVLDAVTRAWPGAPEPAARGLVLELVRRGFLLTDLLPDCGGDDPLGHLLRKLPLRSALRADLEQVRGHLADADAFPPGAAARLKALAEARDAADRVVVCERPFSVDVAVDARLVLPAGLAEDAAGAAGVLWRIGSRPDPLAGYHDRFVARYGPHRAVRLADAADPVVGIGTDVTGSEAAMPAESTAVLASLITSATGGHRVEVDLDDATVEALVAASGSQDALPPRTAEAYVRVIADSPEAAASGHLRLAVCPGGYTQDAGSSSGRFASLLPGLSETGYQDQGAVVAELAVRTRTVSGMLLAPPTGFAKHRIPLGVAVSPGDLDPDDLLLVSDGQLLQLWSARLDQRIVPVLYSRLSPQLLPPIAQLLRMLGNHGCRPWQTWSWGPLAGTPFQPRVRYRTTILTPARWVLPPAVEHAAHHPGEWDAALEEWRTATVPVPPDIVVVTDHDRALPLDLRRADDRALLRRHVRRGISAVTEQPGGSDAIQGVVAGPAGQHALELVISLARAQSPAVPPLRPSAAARPVRRPGEGLRLPGSDWLSLTISTPAACQDEVLTRVGALAAGFPAPWFWLRYSDHVGPHLRVRFHADPACLGGHVLPAMAALTAELITGRLASGLSAEPYEQEIERYGGSRRAMTAAEHVFIADSGVALAVLTADASQRIVIAALSAATIARTVADGDRAALVGHHLDRGARCRLVELRPRTRAAARNQVSGLLTPPADKAWTARDAALAAYRNTLHPARRASCASSLIHLHANRLLGGTPLEPLARALAADLLFLPQARSRHPPPP
jgi:thiopeptide-type bacteriocin biosynthesis protein